MKVLIVSFYDDNYGDNLIRVCFENILKTVFGNLKITNNIFNKMSLKDIDVELIYNSDIIFFAGGGLFGLSYLNFFDYLDKIVNIADEKNIPVIFSSIGINNMDISSESKYKLENLLSKKCIKAISVRENISLFNEYAKNCNCNIVEVCDPAVWTKYVYGINKSTDGKNKTIGINVVRGGLFKDNNKNWVLADEEKYIMKLKKSLDELGYNYLFYTNGSFLDDNALRYIARKNNIPNDRIVYNNTTKELVNTISQFDFVIAIRMHSSIISYSLEIPCYNLVWNDKIPLFYQNINYADRVIALDDEMMIEKILNGIDENLSTKSDHKYMMSLY
ncbi:MAG: polysaccharide pyruvyl transferase family protein, partial [Erysipelotrichaceae bacterium]|nr:polysaccharide pyruvyl transferase family protein [Erysipelotrichaceae bacterium]